MFEFKTTPDYTWIAKYTIPADGGKAEMHEIRVRFKRIDQATGELYIKRLGLTKPAEGEVVEPMTQAQLLDEVMVSVYDSQGTENAWGLEVKDEVAKHLGMRGAFYDAWLDSYNKAAARAKN